MSAGGRTVERERPNGDYIVRGGADENNAVLGRFHCATGVEASREQAEQLARELAAAPDLAEALERVLPEIEHGGWSATAIASWLRDARAALSKARGGE